jgi:hypothetical protein
MAEGLTNLDRRVKGFRSYGRHLVKVASFRSVGMMPEEMPPKENSMFRLSVLVRTAVRLATSAIGSVALAALAVLLALFVVKAYSHIEPVGAKIVPQKSKTIRV